MSPFRRMRGEPGYTLVELAAVMAIIALLASVAIPLFAYTLDSLRAKNAAYLIGADIRYAQALAQREGKRTRVVLGSRGYEVQVGDSPTAPESCPEVRTYTVQVARASSLSSNADLLHLEVDPGSLNFWPGQDQYELDVSSTMSQMTVKAIPEDPYATVMINRVVGNRRVVDLEVGTTWIEIQVVAEDQFTTRTYWIIVNRPGTVDLSDLKVNEGSLSPTFDPNVLNYTVQVSPATTTVTITAWLADPDETILYFDLRKQNSGQPKAITLTGSSTQVKILVRGPIDDKTYTVTITKPPASSDASLSSLTVSQGSLAPRFAPAQAAYTVEVGSTVSSLAVTASVAESHATLQINGTTVASGTPRSITLNGPGIDTTITILVKAENGTTTRTYTVTVKRPAGTSTNAFLSDLTIGSWPLSPAFSGQNTFNYTATVPYSTAQVDLVATAAGVNATMTINGQATPSGTAKSLPLNVGANTVTIVVKAADGVTTKTYTLVVTRSPLSNLADLSTLQLSPTPTGYTFSPAKTDYQVSVAFTVTSITVTPTLADPLATMTLNGQNVASGAPTAVNLALGSNSIAIRVTAQSGAMKTYNLTINRSYSARLSDLQVDQGQLAPAFSPAVLVYDVTVPSGVSRLALTAVLTDESASLTINGFAEVSGHARSTLLNPPGQLTVIHAVVLSKAGERLDYQVQVHRAATGGGAGGLANLEASHGRLEPAFDPGTTAYTVVDLGQSVNQVEVTATATQPDLWISINGGPPQQGVATHSVDLTPGVATVTILVTLTEEEPRYSLVKRVDLTEQFRVELPADIPVTLGCLFFEPTGRTGWSMPMVINDKPNSVGERLARVYFNGAFVKAGSDLEIDPEGILITAEVNPQTHELQPVELVVDLGQERYLESVSLDLIEVALDQYTKMFAFPTQVRLFCSSALATLPNRSCGPSWSLAEQPPNWAVAERPNWRRGQAELQLNQRVRYLKFVVDPANGPYGYTFALDEIIIPDPSITLQSVGGRATRTVTIKPITGQVSIH